MRRPGARVPVFNQAQTDQPRKSNMPQECSVRASSNTHSFESSGIVLLKEAKAVFLFTNLPTTQVKQRNMSQKSAWGRFATRRNELAGHLISEEASEKPRRATTPVFLLF